jgi:hypothetical protein
MVEESVDDGYHDEHAVRLSLRINGVEVRNASFGLVQKRTICTMEYDWTPPSIGTYNLTAYVAPIMDEMNLTNNVQSSFINAHWFPHVYISTPANVWPGDNIIANVTVKNVTNLHSVEFTLYYRSYVLNVTSISEGSLLRSAGQTTFEIVYCNDLFNGTCGCIHVRCSLTDPSESVNGSGAIAVIACRVDGGGICRLTLSGVTLATTSNPTTPCFIHQSGLIAGLIGDIDGDMKVTVLDVVKITSIYGSKLDDTKYDPACDIDGNGAINILDVILCTSHYGQKWP